MDFSDGIVKVEHVLYDVSPYEVFNVDITKEPLDVQPLFAVVDNLLPWMGSRN